MVVYFLQIGKTGTFVHFLRVLSRMLIRLQEVEVIDEEDQEIEVPSSDWNVSGSAAVKWPDYEALVKMPFDFTLRHGRAKNHSPVWTETVKLGRFLEKKNIQILSDISSFDALRGGSII